MKFSGVFIQKSWISRVINLSSKQVGQVLDRFLHYAFHLYVNNRQCWGSRGREKERNVEVWRASIKNWNKRPWITSNTLPLPPNPLLFFHKRRHTIGNKGSLLSASSPTVEEFELSPSLIHSFTHSSPPSSSPQFAIQPTTNRPPTSHCCITFCQKS